MSRQNTLLPAPENPKYKLAHVGFTAPGGPDFNTDKDVSGNRYDAIPICNGVISAGASCDLVVYDTHKHADFVKLCSKYDAFIVRVNPGQLSVPGTAPGAQERFDDFMSSLVKKGKPVWSSPDVQTKMGAKDALCKISQLSCDKLKLMEMNDNHVEYHTVGEFLEFCVN
eukprot:gene25056-30568_t